MTLGARLIRTTNQTVPSFLLTAVSFTSAQWDTDACFSPGQPTRLTCRTSGTYLIQGSVQFAANGQGPRDLGLRLNGETFIVGQRNASVGPSSPSDMNITAVYRMTAGDYVEFTVNHYATPSGTNLDLVAASDFSPRFAMVRIAPL